jgi:hypothetical protein
MAIAPIDEPIYNIIQQNCDSGENLGDLFSMLMNASEEDGG